MIQPADFKLETHFWKQGIDFVAGADEVGRGAWAGPVVAAAVVFPQKVKFPQSLFDSKAISANRREQLSELIYQYASFIGIGSVGVATINKVGIGAATHSAFRKAIKNLAVLPGKILVDAFYIKRLRRLNQVPVKDGDSVCASIAAASIIAKVYRDSHMKKISKNAPAYNFAVNKGYGTKNHQIAIRANNFSAFHRTSFNLSYLLD